MNSGDKAYANTPSGGSPLGFNTLFVRLNNIRANHLNKDGQNATANSTFATAFPTSVSVQGNAIPQSEPQRIKDELNTLSQSAWLTTTFASKITVPAVGDLITAANFNTWSSVISEVEAICANYSQYGSQYSQYNNYGNDYSEYGSQYSEYNNYGSKYSQYNNDYSKYSEYTGKYGYEYNAYGAYTGKYGYQYSACVDENTKIILKNNLIKSIKELKIGEEILSYNEKNNTFDFKKILAIKVHSNINNKLIKITFSNKEFLILTSDHPILSLNGWKSKNIERSKIFFGVDVTELKNNDKILSSNGTISIEKIEEINNPENYTLYDIFIDDCYAFLANNTIVL